MRTPGGFHHDVGEIEGGELAGTQQGNVAEQNDGVIAGPIAVRGSMAATSWLSSSTVSRPLWPARRRDEFCRGCQP